MMKSLRELNTVDRSRAICDYCLQDVTHNRQGEFEEMLFCKDCDAKAHPSCMKYSSTLAAQALSYPWQCVECKTCSSCFTARDGASILFCDGCDKAYHMLCHEPEVITKPEGKWLCSSCLNDPGISLEDFSEEENGLESDVASFSSELQTSGANSTRLSTVSPPVNSNHSQINNIPDSTNWTAAQVAEYFTNAGFTKQASVFAEEEIDGKSLLLLQKTDVVSGMTFKLGPAVKIYEHIVKLQRASSRKRSYHQQNGMS
uniref:Zinc finger protein n=1 Tax=Ciona intestinalis TaxID=7719 RepID=Q1RPX0_CIOIN|nr:zinc finger protein [Ciona intestinalis]BAE93315.1 zinc finger protein [Ciona intestinalis]|eukprot:NP_001071920.1 zinc finger protein [Ciona intestinalis]